MTTKNKTNNDIFAEFQSVLDKGNEAEARQFLADNLLRFPEDVQEKITFAFFEEALSNQVTEMEGVKKVEKEASELFTSITKEKKELENEIKVQDIKKDLGV